MIWCDVIDSGQVHPSFSNTMFGGVWIWQYRLPSWLQVPKNLFVLTLFLVQKAKIKNHGVQHEIDKVWLSTRKQLDGEAPNKPNYPIQTSWRVKPVKLPSIFRTARNHHPQTKQQTKPWDKMMQHVTSCLKLSKEIHYCKTVSDKKTPNKCAKEGILLSPLTFISHHQCHDARPNAPSANMETHTSTAKPLPSLAMARRNLRKVATSEISR